MSQQKFFVSAVWCWTSISSATLLILSRLPIHKYHHWSLSIEGNWRSNHNLREVVGQWMSQSPSISWSWSGLPESHRRWSIPNTLREILVHKIQQLGLRLAGQSHLVDLVHLIEGIGSICSIQQQVLSVVLPSKALATTCLQNCLKIKR